MPRSILGVLLVQIQFHKDVQTPYYFGYQLKNQIYNPDLNSLSDHPIPHLIQISSKFNLDSKFLSYYLKKFLVQISSTLTYP